MSRSREKRSRDLWRPRELDQDRARFLLRCIRDATYKLENDLHVESILTDLDYAKLFDSTEELYGVLDVGSLVQDNKRREQEVKAKVKEREEKSGS